MEIFCSGIQPSGGCPSVVLLFTAVCNPRIGLRLTHAGQSLLNTSFALFFNIAAQANELGNRFSPTALLQTETVPGSAWMGSIEGKTPRLAKRGRSVGEIVSMCSTRCR